MSLNGNAEGKPHLRTVTYRLTGPGQRQHKAVFDAREWAEPDSIKDLLVGKLGVLASFEIGGFEPLTLCHWGCSHVPRWP